MCTYSLDIIDRMSVLSANEQEIVESGQNVWRTLYVMFFCGSPWRLGSHIDMQIRINTQCAVFNHGMFSVSLTARHRHPAAERKMPSAANTPSWPPKGCRHTASFRCVAISASADDQRRRLPRRSWSRRRRHLLSASWCHPPRHVHLPEAAAAIDAAIFQSPAVPEFNLLRWDEVPLVGYVSELRQHHPLRQLS